MLFIWFACAINQFRRRKKQRMKEEKRNIFRICNFVAVTNSRCIYHWLSTSIDNIYIFWFIYGQWKIKIFHTMINVWCPANPNKNLSKCQNTHCLTKNVDLFIRFVSVRKSRVSLLWLIPSVYEIGSNIWRIIADDTDKQPLFTRSLSLSLSQQWP